MDHFSPGRPGGPGGLKAAAPAAAPPAGLVSPVLQSTRRQLSSSTFSPSSPASAATSPAWSGTLSPSLLRKQDNPSLVHQMHLRGTIDTFLDDSPSPSRRPLVGTAAHQPSRSDLLVNHSYDDVLRNFDMLPQQVRAWDEFRETMRLRRHGAPERFFHGTRAAQRPAQYLESLAQAKRSHEHQLHCTRWTASLRSPTAAEAAAAAGGGGGAAAAGRRGSPRRLSGEGHPSAAASASAGGSGDAAAAMVVVTLADLLVRMQAASGSRAFCNAEDFEAVLLDLGISKGFDDPLVRTVARLCPISADGVITFTPLYAACDEAGHLHHLPPPPAAAAATTALLTPHDDHADPAHPQHGDANTPSPAVLPLAAAILQTPTTGHDDVMASATAAVPSRAGGATAGAESSSSAAAAARTGYSSASSAAAAVVATTMTTTTTTSTTMPSSSSASVRETPAKSADLFPVHEFANSPLPAGTPPALPAGAGAGTALHSAPFTGGSAASSSSSSSSSANSSWRSSQSRADNSPTVSLLVEL